MCNEKDPQGEDNEETPGSSRVEKEEETGTWKSKYILERRDKSSLLHCFLLVARKSIMTRAEKGKQGKPGHH